MTAIVNTYTKINPYLIAYKTIIKEASTKKEIILYIQNEHGTLTADKIKAMTFTTTSAALPHFIKIVNSFKRLIPNLQEKVQIAEPIVISISNNRWIEIVMDRLQPKKERTFRTKNKTIE